MTANNWPNPATGYHWLKCKSEQNSDLEIFYWDQEDEVFRGIGDVGCVDKFCFPKHWEYHGPVLTPAQITEKDAEIAQLREALVTARDAITSDLNTKSIVCTVWAAPAETLVDYIDDTLKGDAT